MKDNFVIYRNKKNKKYYLFYNPSNIKKEVSRELYQVINRYICSKKIDKCLEDKLLKLTQKREKSFNTNSVMEGYSMYNSEKEKLSYLNNYKEIIFFGFPYDLGSTNYAGSRVGPTLIRRNSTSIYEITTDSDIELMMKDIGDIRRGIFKTNSVDFDYCSNIVEILMSKNKIPIILGGDHSITYAVLKGIINSNKNVGVIQFDAHQDFQERSSEKNWREHMHHGNFLNWIIEESNIENIYQFGIDKYAKIYKDEKLKTYTVEDTLENIDNILKNIDKSIPYYITFDVDCLSTELLTSTGTIIPGGFTYREINTVIKKIKEYGLNIIGIDFVELNDRKEVDSLNVARLILDFISILR